MSDAARPRVVVAVLVHDQADRLVHWLRAWEETDKIGAELVVVGEGQWHHGAVQIQDSICWLREGARAYDPDDDDDGRWDFTVKPDDRDVRAFRDFIQIHRDRFDILVWCSDAQLPVRWDWLRAFVSPFADPGVGLVGNQQVTPSSFGMQPYFRMACFAIRRDAADLLRFSEPDTWELGKQGDLSGFEGQRGNMTEQVLRMTYSTMLVDPLCRRDDGTSFVRDTESAHMDAPSTSKVKLHFGCGGMRLEGWQNHDLDVDLAKPLPFDANSVDFIFTEHVVEHLTIQQAWNYFGECHRILKPTGVVRTTVPSIVKVWGNKTDDYIRFVQQSGWGDGTPASAIQHLVFNHEHQSLWTPELLKTVLAAHGFRSHETYPHFSLYAELRGIEQHGKSIGHDNNDLESISVEGVK